MHASSPSLSGPPSIAAADKSAWRARLRGLRAVLRADAGRHAALSGRLQRHLLASPVWRQARTVFLYRAVRGEADTTLLLDEAWASGRTVLLPRCRPAEKGVMDAVPCTGPRELKPGIMNIPEPCGAPVPETALPALLDDALIVVPGLAFDREGYRLGYGGGYYDRLLALAPPEKAGFTRSVGLAFAEHVFDRLPREPWDVPVKGLCTEEELLWI